MDLDFFLDGIHYWEEDDTNRRLPDSDFKPLGSEAVREFLEQRCGLSTAKRRPGRIIEQHQEAFFFWRELIDQRDLEAPFDLVHVDAHSDMGLGNCGWYYVLTKLLALSPAKRPHAGLDKLGSGNFLLFVLACRWVKSLTFVLHPKYDWDIQDIYFKDFDCKSEFIQLKQYSVKDLDCCGFWHYPSRFPPLSLEPKAPFYPVKSEVYSATKGFDYVVLSRSPNFTPPAADKLLPVFKEYMDLI